MKKHTLSFLLFLTGITQLFAQNNRFTENFKKQFAGTWVRHTRFQTSTFKIKFEAGKDYATIKDIGSGETTPFELRASRKGSILVVAPFQEHNDYCEFEVKNGKLVFRQYLTIWNADGTPQPLGFSGKMVFKKVKSKE